MSDESVSSELTLITVMRSKGWEWDGNWSIFLKEIELGTGILATISIPDFNPDLGDEGNDMGHIMFAASCGVVVYFTPKDKERNHRPVSLSCNNGLMTALDTLETLCRGIYLLFAADKNKEPASFTGTVYEDA